MAASPDRRLASRRPLLPGAARTPGRGDGPRRPGGRRLVDPRQLLGREANPARGDVLLEVRPALGAGDGNDVLALMEHPGQGELPGGHSALGGYLPDPVDQPQVEPEVLAGEAR